MITIKIDKNRRENLRRLHSVTHILNHSCKKILGEHIWQNGSNLNEEYGTLDITHYKPINLEDIKKIEKEVNKIIFENRDIKIENLKRNEAEEKYSFTIYQGGAIPQTNLRIVKIDGGDIEACGGLHSKKTGEIGFFKIENIVKIQDGVLRIKYRVFEFAFDLVFENDKLIEDLKNLYGVSKESIVFTSKKFFDGFKSNTKKIENKDKIIQKLIVENIKSNKLKNYFLDFEINLNEILNIFELTNKSCDIESSLYKVCSNLEDEKKFKKVIKKENYYIGIK